MFFVIFKLVGTETLLFYGFSILKRDIKQGSDPCKLFFPFISKFCINKKTAFGYYFCVGRNFIYKSYSSVT